MMKKLISKRGESLVEALFAILIIALGSAMFARMVMVSVNIADIATDHLESSYAELTAAETESAYRTGTVVFQQVGSASSVTFQVEYYGLEDGALTAYGETS